MRTTVTRWLPPTAFAALGVVLLYLAVPRTIAAAASLEAQPALGKLQAGRSPSDLELDEGASGLQRALTWIPSARRFTDLALLELEQAGRLPAEDIARQRLLASAEQHLIAGLAANPTNGFAWFRLAIVRELRQTPPEQIAAALVHSVDMAPNERKLWLPRAEMLLAYWSYLSSDEWRAVRAHLRTIWRAHEGSRLPLMQSADRMGRRLLLQWALADDHAAREELERLEKQSPTPAPRSK